jgi:hypothetical protein
MTAKNLFKKFYKSDALIDSTIMKDFLSDLKLDWNSSTGFIQHDATSLLHLADELGKAYVPVLKYA